MIGDGHHYGQTNTNNVNKTWAILQTNGGKDESNIVICENRNGHHNTERKDMYQDNTKN